MEIKIRVVRNIYLQKNEKVAESVPVEKTRIERIKRVTVKVKKEKNEIELG